MSATQTEALLDRLSQLVEGPRTNEPPDLVAIAGVTREIRSLIVPTGVLYASREQAARDRELRGLFQETSNLLRAYYRDDSDPTQLDEVLSKVRSACTLAASEPSEAESAPPSGGELLGDILIVGWW